MKQNVWLALDILRQIRAYCTIEQRSVADRLLANTVKRTDRFGRHRHVTMQRAHSFQENVAYTKISKLQTV